MPFSRSRAAVLGIAAAMLAVLVPGVAHAQPPGNDDFDAATVITTLPFAADGDANSATRDVDDPTSDCSHRDVARTVWFRYTATEDGFLRFGTGGDGDGLPVTAYTGERGDLRRPAGDNCSWDGSRPATLRVEAGTTYHLLVNDNNTSDRPFRLSVERVAVPANDAFADATVVTSLPFGPTTERPDLSAASAEPDEPFGSCAWEGAASVWYRYTPQQNQFLLAETGNAYLTVYEGTAVEDLRALACASGADLSGRVVELTAGRTYHFQLAGQGHSLARIGLFDAPELGTFLGYAPYGDQSIHDKATTFTVSHSNDYGSSITTEWDFGDGTTLPATGVKEQQHHYAADGTYAVTVRSKSADGRVASATQNVVVKTRDVGITSFKTPALTMPGRPVTVTVGLANHRYAASPRVEFYRSDQAFGWRFIGEKTVQMAADSTTDVSASHRITTEDAAVGKISFRAVVYLSDRDSRQDNEVISIPTTIDLVTPAAAHDAGITKFTAPATAAAGEQKAITVQVRNDAFAERAVVTFTRLDRLSWLPLGEQTIDLPASATINVPFAYTFTAEDARIGKVAFRATVRLTSSSDTRAAGNDVIAVATTVGPSATAAVLN
ncbi:PKD domain-containing protein [Lentzea sp. NPDC058450]|uniref:PKD domain-containing protein n=1 Tax=Lentzea sp. NPDC058450 TaxID=3346505 RepID=UPI003666ED79